MTNVQASETTPSVTRWVALAALLTAEAMNLLDATVVQVAAPSMRNDLGGSDGDLQWFTAAYTLPFAVLLVLGGRLGDLAGRRRVFVLGVTGFTVLSLCCAAAPTAGVLIALRAVQGAFAALVIPQTIGLIKAMFAGPEVGKALGTIGPVMGLAGVAGPILGGALTHADLFGTSWRTIFLVNVPLGVVVLLISRRIREDRSEHAPGLDLVGAVLLAAAVALLVFPVIDGLPAGPSTVLLVAGALLLGGFALQQRDAARRDRPTSVELSLFTGWAFPAALLTSTAFFAVMNGLMLVVVVQLQQGAHVGALAAGATLLPWSAGLGAASWFAGARLIERFGPRLMLAGLGIELLGIGAAILAYATAAPDTYPVWLLPALGVCGIGIGLFAPTFFTASLHQVAPAEVGSAAGLLNAVQQFGATVGVAVLGAAFFSASASTTGAEVAFTIAAGLLLVAALSARLITRPHVR